MDLLLLAFSEPLETLHYFQLTGERVVVRREPKKESEKKDSGKEERTHEIKLRRRERRKGENGEGRDEGTSQ